MATSKQARGTFTVESFTPAEVTPAMAITTAVDVGVATIGKRYEGAIEGRSSTLFTAAFDQAAGVGTYVAMESFEGTVDGVAGAFNFAHSATTGGTDRTDEFFLIVPSSGTGSLAGIRGAGGMAIDDDGTHRVWFDYDLAD
jgi:endoglucanase Acf2